MQLCAVLSCCGGSLFDHCRVAGREIIGREITGREPRMLLPPGINFVWPSLYVFTYKPFMYKQL